MKKIISYLFIISTFYSCGPNIYFEQSQPASSKMENVFPEVLHGRYYDTLSGFSIIIDKFTCEFGDTSLVGMQKLILSDSLILKKLKSYFILSFMDDKTWEVAVISRLDGDRLAIYLLNGEEPEEVEKLKKLTTVKEVLDKNGEIDCYIINPNKNEFKSMLREKMFSAEMIFVRVNE